MEGTLARGYGISAQGGRQPPLPDQKLGPGKKNSAPGPQNLAPGQQNLAPDQKDEDSLPPYEVLDRILELYVELDFSAEAIIEQGMDREHVERVLRLVDINEYKRRQAPIGVRISQRGFGRDRRYPITSAWRIGH